MDDAIPSSMQFVAVVRKGLVGTFLKFGALESKIHIFPTIPPVLLVEPPGGSLALVQEDHPPNRFTENCIITPKVASQPRRMQDPMVFQ